MSGIFGVYFMDGRTVDRSELESMSLSLAHRGPDGAHSWNHGSLGLGHLMLHTTPESLQERLPLVKRGGELVLTADARIDNRDELLSSLNVDAPLRGFTSDSELIFLAYEQWGEKCPSRLLGDFAFVLWDARKKTLFCARDHMGVKPFYYHLSNQVFVFASEPKAVLCRPEVPRAWNEAWVADCLASLLDDKSATLYRDIVRLPAGHALTVSCGRARVESYWSPDPTREIRFKTDQEYAEAFRSIFTQAVGARLRSAFPVGSMLSGGLDSSSIACTAGRLLAKEGSGPLRTFSAVFNDVSECDERSYIDAVLASGGMQPHFIHADRLSPLADREIFLDQQDEAFCPPNLFMHRALYGAARERGVRVLLDGIDGDTVVSHGVAYLPELALQGRWLNLMGQIRGLSKNFKKPTRQIFRNHVLSPLLPVVLRRSWQALHGRSQPAWMIENPTIRRDFAERSGLVERCRRSHANWRGTLKNERRNHATRLDWGAISFVLEVSSKSATAFSIEPCFPFFDRRLIEFCLALPGDQKIHRGWTRMVMRRAMVGVLPETVQWREGKSNLSPNFKHGLLFFEKKIMDDVIIHDPQVLEPYVDIPSLRQAYSRCFSQGNDKDLMTVWKAVTLALTLRRIN